MITVPGAEWFGSTIALTTTVTPPHPRAAVAFEEFSLGIARELYPAYGFVAMAPDEFGQVLALG